MSMCSSWQDFVPFATKKIQVFTAKKLYLAQVTFGIYELGSAMRGTLINNIFVHSRDGAKGVNDVKDAAVLSRFGFLGLSP